MDTTLSRPNSGQLLDGRYRVGSWIARGGMATVYLGIDTKLDRAVALKIAHAELAGDQEFVRRFTGEARSVARLSSPNVVAVYDQGSDGDVLYLVMEYIPGRTLRELLRERGRLGPREALDIINGVLTGLAAAHQAGIVHRDVKPENVLLGEGDTVKVADFGLARAAAAVSHTRTGMLIGTAAYLAPEQVSRSTSDARTDVYAAGVMLFEMLTGAQPHTGDSPLAVAEKHVSDVVPAPSSLVSSLPPSLDALVALATSRDPELRPADAGQFLHAITDVRRGMPIGSPQPEPLAHQAQHLPPGGPVPGTSALAGPDAVSFAGAPASDFAGTPASDFAGAGASDFPGEVARPGAPADDFRSPPASDLLRAAPRRGPYHRPDRPVGQGRAVRDRAPGARDGGPHRAHRAAEPGLRREDGPEPAQQRDPEGRRRPDRPGDRRQRLSGRGGDHLRVFRPGHDRRPASDRPAAGRRRGRAQERGPDPGRGDHRRIVHHPARHRDQHEPGRRHLLAAAQAGQHHGQRRPAAARLRRHAVPGRPGDSAARRVPAERGARHQQQPAPGDDHQPVPGAGPADDQGAGPDRARVERAAPGPHP